jgi:RNA polymerase sigma-70 factor (ECF subfamily)
LYAFIRRQGYSEADAEDLTQEFFARLLERNGFESVSPLKGKFRTFLLKALSNFLSNRRAYDHAAKRGGGQQLLSLEEIQIERQRHLEPVSLLSPDKAFDARWALAILDKALAALKEEMTLDGKARQFEEIKGFISKEVEEGEYDEAAKRLRITKQALGVAAHRLRRRYRELVIAEVSQTVCGPLELEEEMRHLFAILSSAPVSGATTV